MKIITDRASVLQYSHKNGCGGAISVTERSCAVPISKVKRDLSDRFCAILQCSVKIYSARRGSKLANLAIEEKRQLTTAYANQSTGLTNGRAANWAPEVEFSPFRALSRRQMTFPFCC